MPIYPYSFTLPPVNKQDIPSDGVAGEFLGISAGGVLDWLPVSGGSGSGDLLAANNLSELTATAGTARTNLGLGTTDTPTFKNLTISTGSIATSAPVTISQTWAAVGQTFKALVVDAAGTSDANSASGSLLLDLQLNGVSQVSVKKSGQTVISSLGSAAAPSFIIGANCGFYQPTNTVLAFASNSENVLRMYSLGLVLGAKYLGFGASVTTEDTILLRDGAANTLALRNSTAAQTFRVYNTYTDASNYERGFAQWSSNVFFIGYEAAGTGSTSRTVVLRGSSTGGVRIDNGANVGFEVRGGNFLGLIDNTYDIGASGANRPKDLYVANAITAGSIGSASGNDFILRGASVGAAWKITPSGHLVTQVDNTYDIGASGANRPRNVYVGTSVFVGSGTGTGIYHPTFGGLAFQASGVVTVYGGSSYTTFDRLQIGGVTASYPALKRSTTSLQAVLANDSGFTNIQGKLTTDTAYTGTTVVPTGFITLYDSTGTAYKVPCVAA